MEEKFDTIRRKDRVLDRETAIRLLEKGEYGILSMVGENGYGYGLPLSYVLEDEHIYFHCAPEGMKLNNLKKDNRVSFCVVGKTCVIPEKFTTEYESTLVFGMISEGLPECERLHALRLIVKKYSPDYVEMAEKYITASFHRTNVLRLDIETISGKAEKAGI